MAGGGIGASMDRAEHSIVRTTAFKLLLAILTLHAAQAAAEDIVTESGPFGVAIGGAVFKLEGSIARPAAPSGKLPVALLVPGQATASQMNLSAAQYPRMARDLAARGWLAAVVIRRGYGQSEGPKPAPVSCESASLMQRLASDADDLEAVLAFLRRRPDADPGRAIAIGVAGAGASVVALSARNPPGLKAVVSISGGLRAETNCPWAPPLVEAFGEFGMKSRVPNLWMYAKNDSVFTADVTEKMHAKFLDGGGDVTFMMFEPVGKEGQTLFSDPSGHQQWLRQTDAFLRAHALATWTRADVDNIMKRLNYQNDFLHPAVLNTLSSYFATPGEKALAHSGATAFVGTKPALWYSAGRPSLDVARKGALDQCQNNAGACAIVMENFAWVGGN
jgi:dienelactone hydrolase